MPTYEYRYLFVFLKSCALYYEDFTLSLPSAVDKLEGSCPQWRAPSYVNKSSSFAQRWRKTDNVFYRFNKLALGVQDLIKYMLPVLK